MQINIGQPILDRNDKMALANREIFDKAGVFVVNVLASPGSGKTSTILATIEALRDEFNIAVIEGDIASKVDSEKIKEFGIPCVQINTGGICHLESQMIAEATKVLNLDSLDLIIVENVGNLVCTTDFYLGEDAKIVILSVPEGDDKPLKYPVIFEEANAVVLNKIDVLPYFNFDVELFGSHMKNLNALAPVFQISATRGDGMQEWTQWLKGTIKSLRRSKS